MEIITKRGNRVAKERYKYWTKLYIGYLKQCADQDAKPEISSIDTGLKSFDEEKYEYGPLMQKFWNNKWNGMNLKNLRNAARVPPSTGEYYSKFSINKETGKYRLSYDGKQRLRKRREKLAQVN